MIAATWPMEASAISARGNGQKNRDQARIEQQPRDPGFEIWWSATYIARFELMGVSCRHTRNFSKIPVNKITNLRKSDYPKIFRRAKSIFSKKNTMQ
jgi:hypothetical protein